MVIFIAYAHSFLSCAFVATLRNWVSYIRTVFRCIDALSMQAAKALLRPCVLRVAARLYKNNIKA